MTHNQDDMTVDQAIACLNQATSHDLAEQAARPDPAAVVAAMLVLEQQARRDRPPLTSLDLQGTWQLRFITGTQSARRQAGLILGQGRYVPGWIRIVIAYHPQAQSPQIQVPQIQVPQTQVPQTQGQIINQVGLGPLSLTVSGPWEIIAGKRISSFDFVNWAVGVGRMRLGSGQVRNTSDPATAADRFYASPLKERAFFNFFWTSEGAIAARGRGGGLALWQSTDEITRPDSSQTLR